MTVILDHQIFAEPLVPYSCPGYFIRAASTVWERSGAQALRHRVFVGEQAIFTDHDRDEIDRYSTTLVALSTYGHEADEVVGTVRIHQAEPGLWWGSRLAVEKRHRRVSHLGSELIRLAVATANGRGCDRFLAHVQAQNVELFQSLDWHLEEMTILHGRAHGLMRADLGAYPPIADPDTGWLTVMNRNP